LDSFWQNERAILLLQGFGESCNWDKFLTDVFVVEIIGRLGLFIFTIENNRIRLTMVLLKDDLQLKNNMYYY